MSLTEDHNADEIAKLQRWRRRVSMIFYGSLLEILLGLFCPCLTAGILNMNHVALQITHYVMLSAVLLPLIGVAGMLLMLADRRRTWRCLELARLADERGLRYAYQPGKGDVAAIKALRYINLLRVSDQSTAHNLVQGTFKKRPIRAADFSFNYFHGNRVFNTHQTIVLFEEGFDGYPDCVVSTQGLGEKIEQFIAETPFGKTMKVPGEDDFNRHFTVAGLNRKAILACLSSEVIDLLMEERRLMFLIQEGVLAVSWRDVVVAAPQYEEFLASAYRLARALERAGAR